MNNAVFVVREFDRYVRELGIYGVYSTQEKAEKALEKDYPWIRFDKERWVWSLGDRSNFFRVDEYTVDF